MTKPDNSKPLHRQAPQWRLFAFDPSSELTERLARWGFQPSRSWAGAWWRRFDANRPGAKAFARTVIAALKQAGCSFAWREATTSALRRTKHIRQRPPRSRVHFRPEAITKPAQLSTKPDARAFARYQSEMAVGWHRAQAPPPPIGAPGFDRRPGLSKSGPRA